MSININYIDALLGDVDVIDILLIFPTGEQFI